LAPVPTCPLTARMSQRPLGFGIWGTGMIAEFHAKALAEIAGVKLVAAYNRSPAKGRDFAAKHGITFAETPEALLADPAVDIVCLCTPSGDHLAPALACAKAGKHVVVEKPLEVTLARCDELTAACAKAGVTVAGILPRRFGAGAVALKAALDAGRFGKLTMAGALIPWWRTQAYYDSAAWRGTFALDGGGAVMNQGIHTVDLLLWFLGAPKKVSATAGLVAHAGIEVEDIATGWIEFANGCRATLASSTACWSATGFPAEIRIHGTTGAAVLRDDKLTAFEFEKALPADASVVASATEGGGAGANDPKAIGHAWHRANLEEAVAAIRAGKQPAVNGAEGRKAVELILALYQSAQAGGAPVELPLARDPDLKALGAKR
ncbi:MAG: 1,5-anhydro-D-fructose reductase, partial [Verrucomicrobiota bacterium]